MTRIPVQSERRMNAWHCFRDIFPTKQQLLSEHPARTVAARSRTRGQEISDGSRKAAHARLARSTPRQLTYQPMLTSVDADRSEGQRVAQLRALADPLRLRIVRLLAREALCTCHIVAETGARQTNVSNHLRLLRHAGIVTAEPYGRYTYYRLSADVAEQIVRDVGELAESARAVDGADVRRPCP